MQEGHVLERRRAWSATLKSMDYMQGERKMLTRGEWVGGTSPSPSEGGEPQAAKTSPNPSEGGEYQAAKRKPMTFVVVGVYLIY